MTARESMLRDGSMPDPTLCPKAETEPESRERTALRRCLSAAGNPDAAEGCRQIIRIAQGALEPPDFDVPGDDLGY